MVNSLYLSEMIFRNTIIYNLGKGGKYKILSLKSIIFFIFYFFIFNLN